MLADVARESGLSITIHAGEVGSAQSVMDAIQNLKADRIGHGIKSLENPSVLKRLIEMRIPLEICISSNVKSGVVKSLNEHPIRPLWDQGAVVTINTDDITLCRN